MIIQRAHTLFFLIAGIIQLAMPFVGFTNSAFQSDLISMYPTLAGGAISITAIFFFKKLKIQSFLAKFAILLNAIAIISIIYREMILSGGASAPEKGIEWMGLLLLLACMVLLLLAGNSVKKDLRLVKSSNSLR